MLTFKTHTSLTDQPVSINLDPQTKVIFETGAARLAFVVKI
jgi:hypothetical protein